MSFPSLSSGVALAMPGAISPALAGIVVGALIGVAAFLAIVVVATRRGRRREVVTIPPYAACAPYANALARTTSPPRHPHTHPPIVPWPTPPQRFTPSTELSARALARMGIPVGPFGERAPYCEDASAHELDDELDIAIDDEAAVSVAPVVVLGAPPRKASESGPHPSSVIPSSSSAMRGTPPSGTRALAAAPIHDLSFDDGPTEIAETVFDEPPRPPTRSEPPRIRPIQPSPPRFQRGS